MLRSVPLLIVPFILFNLGLAGMLGTGTATPWDQVLVNLPRMAGGSFSMTLGDLLVHPGLFLAAEQLVQKGLV